MVTRLLIGLPGKTVAMTGQVKFPGCQADHHIRAVHVGGELYLPVVLVSPHQRRVSHNCRGPRAENITKNL